MFARTVTAELKEGQLDEFLDYEQTAAREARACAGNVGVYVLTNPSANRIMILTLWESPDATDAAQSVLQAHAGSLANFLLEPARQTYDVALHL